MAKIYGLFGAMTGKLADTVMSVRNGEQIARKYQPVVFNPSSPAQVAQRAKLKMLSQVSAVMAPVIAIPRVGSVSSRNLFTKVNFPNVSFENDQAEITLANIQITKSVVGLGALYGERSSESISIWLGSGESLTDIDRMVYAMFAKGADNRLRYVTSRTVNEIGTGSAWRADFPLVADDVVILAYGVRDNTNAARTTFGNLETVSAETIAKLIVSRVLTETDVTLTETRGYEIPVSSQANHSVSESQGNETRTTKKK